MADTVDVREMSKAELQFEARSRGLSDAGSREDLLQRLQDDQGTDGRHDERGDDERHDERSDARESDERSDPRDDSQRDDDEQPDARDEPDEQPDARDEPDEQPDARDESDEQQQQTPDDEEPSRDAQRDEGDDGGRTSRPRRLDLVLSGARDALAQLSGRQIDAVSGVEPFNGGYRVTLEVVELERVPSTTDVLATYEVDVDGDGQLLSFARTHRYYRNQRTEG